MRSSAFTLAIGYVAVGVVALFLFAAPLWYAWRVTIQDSRTEILSADAQRLSDVFRRDGAAGLQKFIDTRVAMQIANERILLLTDAAYHRVAGNLAGWPSAVPATAGTYTVPVEFDGRRTQAVFVHASLPGGYELLVGRNLARFEPLERRFWYGLSAAAGALVLAGALIGALTRRALLTRIHSIRRTASAIVHGDLSHRLPTYDNGEELDTLSRMINGMLDQIEQLVHGIRNVSNSIAHDLRTPLAELRSRLEELSRGRPSGERAVAELDAAVADVDRVIHIFNALLRLAEIDTGMRRAGFLQVDAAEVAAAAVEFYLPAAELKGITLLFRSSGTAVLSGDRLLLAQALGNLIDNALKYAARGIVTVETRQRSDGAVEISVSDHGPGICEAERPRVVERFYRGDRSRGTQGSGLGLSLVEAVAKLHGSALELSDRGPGLRVVLTMALSGAAPTALAESRATTSPEAPACAQASKSPG